MKLSRPEQRLFDDLRDIPVIDAHEHLFPEQRRLAHKVDFFLLFGHYCQADLLAAGMDGQRADHHDGAPPSARPPVLAGGLENSPIARLTVKV